VASAQSLLAFANRFPGAASWPASPEMATSVSGCTDHGPSYGIGNLRRGRLLPAPQQPRPQPPHPDRQSNSGPRHANGGSAAESLATVSVALRLNRS
jgi:hypothetical protein